MRGERISGQILVITMLVLMTVSVVVVGVIAITTQDTAQTVRNQDYTIAYNAAESRVLDLVDGYATVSANFSLNPDCSSQGLGTYLCAYNQDGYTTQVDVRDTNRIENYELAKDDSIIVDLAGYTGFVDIAWSNSDVALELGLIYQKGVNSYEYIGDFFNAGAVFINGSDPGKFSPTIDSNGVYRITLNNVIDILGAGEQPILLRVTARTADISSTTRITITGGAGFPNQMREFVGTSFQENSDTGVVASVGTQVPLVPQTLSILFQALSTEGIVEKPGL